MIKEKKIIKLFPYLKICIIEFLFFKIKILIKLIINLVLSIITIRLVSQQNH